MEIYSGNATFSGIAIGKILYYYKEEYQIRKYMASNVKGELDDFYRAKGKIIKFLETEYEKSLLEKRENTQSYLKKLQLLETGSFQRAIESMISTENVNAAYAIAITRDEITETFKGLEEPSIVERIKNIKEISNLLLTEVGGYSQKIVLGEEPVILVTESIAPTELMEMEKEKLLAVVTHHGSETSHAAIMAKTMDIPSLINVDVSDEWDGKQAIVDGYTGMIYIDPEQEILKEYEIRQKAEQEANEKLLELKDKEDITLDGKKVRVMANIGNLDDLNSVLFYGANGIGLLRSEFQYLGRENYPRENELFLVYKQVAEAMGEKQVVIRTVDLGADKLAEYMEIPSETNPIMGNRGIRLCLDRKRMFKAQLRAIYRASVYGNLAMMYPMITSEEEVDEINQIIEEVKESLRKKNIPFKNIRTGIMIETPAAVMISRELAKKVDFLSLGTNDLTQYTLAMDKQNPLLRGKYNDHHPALLKMIKMVIDAAHAEGCNVGIAGELAADMNLTKEFLKMGIDVFSVVPACVLPIRKEVRETDLSMEK